MTSARAAEKTVPLHFRAVGQVRLYERIAEQISTMIRERPIAPGTRLPAERDLAKQFQVSRTTVREAMIALETAGLVSVMVGDGIYVREKPERELHLPWAAHGDPGPGPHEQYRVRAVIECAAAEDAAEAITDAEIKELHRLIGLMAADIDGPNAEAHRRSFHLVVAAASRNSIFEELIARLWRLRDGEMWRTLRERVVLPEHHVQALEDRRAVTAALEARDRARAGAAMGQLMERIRSRYFDE
jgi:DNA-binding FadR family transcriptional regulator